MVQDETEAQAKSAHVGLNPPPNARDVVRLFQCALCSYPLRNPITLPCGNSICKPCTPTSHVRANITYPQNAGRAEGFDCPFQNCGVEHSLADCSLDVTLNKMVELVKVHVDLGASQAVDSALQLDEKLDWPSIVDSNIDVMPRSKVLNGGKIVSAFLMAAAGELNYHSELHFTPVEPGADQVVESLDLALLQSLTDTVRTELECHVCYGLMLDPLTTPCGHSFCRKCVARVLDHSTLCPACRRPMSMRPGVSTEPSNKRISQIIQELLANEIAARLMALQEEESMADESWVPLFPCTLGYPSMPTFLHIFEPRYRLMVRRCLENNSRKFGMLMYNGREIPQGNLGRSQYMQYGTMLHISRIEVFNDGRSLLETQGLYRFKVLEGSMVDGYHVGRIQRIDDMPLAEEEAIEALETGGPEPPEEDREARINHMSTQALLQCGLNFITAARARSAHWLHERVLAAYGQPPIDPALFPFWFASVLPMHDEAKYQLLPITSVRERLKMTVRWIRALEESRWPDFGMKSPGQRFLRVARPVEPDSEDETPLQNEAALTETSSEAQVAASNNVAVETEDLHQAVDSREAQHEQHDSPTTQA